jgi:hypothetical protein
MITQVLEDLYRKSLIPKRVAEFLWRGIAVSNYIVINNNDLLSRTCAHKSIFYMGLSD